ncbi:hypothetical protein GCM10009550_20630 [Actinocorallia libanotica]|uniref:Uncharacterized protein n=1 Tax=Actinocorallia libanotica TaxID=46162 RepID=A0ABP4B508_9ACTN
MAAPSAALAEAPVVEGERREPLGRQALGVRPGHLFLHAGERTGEDDPRPWPRTRRKAQKAREPDGPKDDAFRVSAVFKLCHERDAKRPVPHVKEGTFKCPSYREAPCRW